MPTDGHIGRDLTNDPLIVVLLKKVVFPAFRSFRWTQRLRSRDVLPA